MVNIAQQLDLLFSDVMPFHQREGVIRAVMASVVIVPEVLKVFEGPNRVIATEDMVNSLSSQRAVASGCSFLWLVDHHKDTHGYRKCSGQIGLFSHELIEAFPAAGDRAKL